MVHKPVAPRIALNKSYLKVKPNRSDIEKFKTNLIELLDQINEKETEEFHKNIISKFLDKTYYAGNFYINTKGRNDLVVHTDKDAKSTVGVIIEAKQPTNKGEMVQKDNINTKAFQELVLYYMRERISCNNLEVKHLIITNIYEWFIFDVDVFEKSFAQNKDFEKKFIDFEEKRLAGKKTDFFYKEIAEPAVADLISGKTKIGKELIYTHFDIRNYEKFIRNSDKDDDNKLIALYKLLSPEHLLKLPFRNDSNSLDKSFYSELLHIIGLTEIKEGSKKLIDRKEPGNRDEGSILENTFTQLESLDKLSRLEKPMQFGETTKERYFNVGLELAITWVNRVLFLKLLEAQLLAYNKGDRAFSFLNKEKIKSFDDLNSLFFQVLAKENNDRSPAIKSAFANVPYLNSSLFEPSDLEQICFPISQLQDSKTLPILSNTVLKDNSGKRRSGKLNALEYLFAFLDAYDFSNEGVEEIQEENKALINASVLGLIFEKINGYKDGSFFTPGFITMYVCRDTIRRAIVHKFNQSKSWSCKSFEDLYNKIEDKKEANQIINSLKIVDPAVGSGHFLVSALNEIISIKSDLKILLDKSGKTLRDYHTEVSNDELAITDEDGKLFEYNPKNKESQRVQETLFHEKQTIIENCLFGVDVNTNSVKICRLRLWIELLKNAYYKADSDYTELETLPNIDINIKCGNSLISRYSLDIDLSKALKKSKIGIRKYKEAVRNYRHAKSKEKKREMESIISAIKGDFTTEIGKNDPLVSDLKSKKGSLDKIKLQHSLFELSKEEKDRENQKIHELEKSIKNLINRIDAIKTNKAFENAFEWRFDFPEILDDQGGFIGFDVVIGNPPYFSLSKNKDHALIYESLGYKTYSKGADIYCLFYEKAGQILAEGGLITYITSNSWLRAIYGDLLKQYFTQTLHPVSLLNIEDVQVFDEATVESNVITLHKNSDSKKFYVCNLKKDYVIGSSLDQYFSNRKIEFDIPTTSDWAIGSQEVLSLKQKIEANTKKLKDFNIEITRGFLTGKNAAFIVQNDIKNRLTSENANSLDLLKPILRGKDVQKYYHTDPELSVITTFPSMRVDLSNYPSIEKYFNEFGRENLEQDGSKLGRKATKHKWYETQDANSYWKQFEMPKVIWGEISDKPKFSYDESNFYMEATTFLMTGEKLKYLLGILNSQVSEWYFNQISTTTGMGTNRWKKYKIELLPIKIASPELELEIVSIVDSLLAQRAAHSADIEKFEDKLNDKIFSLYGLSAEDINYIKSNLE